MKEIRKSVFYIAGAIIGLLIIFFVAKYIFINPLSREIPIITDTTVLSIQVQEQISDAYKKAHRKPTPENLGMLGMVYHSSAYYALAAKCYQLATDRSKTDWIWNYYNGYLQLEMGNPDSAIVNFLRVTENNPEIHLAWYYLGNAAKNLKNYDLAEKAFNKVATVTSRTSKANATTRGEHFPLGA